MSAKRKGNRNEYKTIKLLESYGCKCTRAAASLGEWDIIGISASKVYLVQVKSNRWPSAAQMQALKDFPAPEYVIKLVHRWDDYKREPKVREI